MIFKKRIYSLTALLFIFSMLGTVMLTVAAAQTIQSSDNIGSWQPPKNFVNPVTMKIQELRSQGLNDDQITTKLAELGMGWDPDTGATWIGASLTPQELAQMPISVPVKDSSTENTTMQQSIMPLDLSERTATMRATSYSWTGVSAEITANSMTSISGQTEYNYACLELGDLDGATNYAETIVMHNAGDTYKWYTNDPDEGGMTYYMDKNTASNAADTYVIMLEGTQDSHGWIYDVWINYQWVRSGHLSMLWCQAGGQRELYSVSGQFNNDASHVIYYRNWLHNANGWSYWTNTVATRFTSSSPIRESNAMGALSYDWETWVQN
jgi:hypothetical protein